jgi:hypothetical protein
MRDNDQKGKDWEIRMHRAAAISFRPVRDTDLALLQQWRGTPQGAAWLSRSPDKDSMEKRFANIVSDRENAHVHILEIDGVPSGCFEQKATSGSATEVPIEFFVVGDTFGDPSYLAEVVREYIATIVCAFNPRVERVVIGWAPDDPPIMAALTAAGFSRSDGRPLHMDLPLSVA